MRPSYNKNGIYFTTAFQIWDLNIYDVWRKICWILELYVLKYIKYCLLHYMYILAYKDWDLKYEIEM